MSDFQVFKWIYKTNKPPLESDNMNGRSHMDESRLTSMLMVQSP